MESNSSNLIDTRASARHWQWAVGCGGGTTRLSRSQPRSAIDRGVTLIDVWSTLRRSEEISKAHCARR